MSNQNPIFLDSSSTVSVCINYFTFHMFYYFNFMTEKLYRNIMTLLPKVSMR